MRDRMDTIRENMASLSDEELVILLREDVEQYEPAALEAAQEELKRRNINPDDFTDQKKLNFLLQNTTSEIQADENIPGGNNQVYEMVPFAEVIQKSFYSLVEKSLQRLHPEDNEFLPDYRKLFQELTQWTPSIHNNIVLKMAREKMYTDGPPVYFWHVFGVDTKSGLRFGLDECKWKDWLGLQVLLEDLEQIGHEPFVAVCLYKMTENGFSEEAMEIKESEEREPEDENITEVHVDSF